MILIDQPLDALLYDARAGNTHSRRMIFDLYGELTRRGEAVPDAVARFVGEQLRKVVHGQQTADQMFNPQHKKRATLDPLPADCIAFLRGAGDIHAKFERIAEDTGLSPSTIKNRYYAYQSYCDRLTRIQALLDERQQGPDLDRGRLISAELIALTT